MFVVTGNDECLPLMQAWTKAYDGCIKVGVSLRSTMDSTCDCLLG